MRRAMLMLLDQPRKVDETLAFATGLDAAGFNVHREIRDPRPGDVLVCWNRQGREHTVAKQFEQAKAHVLITENGYLGSKWRGARWYALARNHHNGRGVWLPEGPERWDSWNISLQPMRAKCSTPPLILAQRGIGEPALRAPERWVDDVRRITGGHVRQHPGTSTAGPTLEAELEGRDTVVTWSSGAALKAMVLGCRCFYGMPAWIGMAAALPLAQHDGKWDRRQAHVDARLPMFQDLAWAMWSGAEIATGEPIRRLTA